MRKRKILWPIFSFIIFLSIILTVTSFLVTKSDFFKNRVEHIFKNIIESNFNVKVRIDEIEGNILTGYIFNGITLYTNDTTKVGTSKFVSIEYNLLSLLTKRKIIKRILIQEPSFDLTKISPHMLVKKKEEELEKGKKKKLQVLALKDVSIIKGNLILNYKDESYQVREICTGGQIYLSSTKNTIFLKRFTAKFPTITDIKSFSGTIIFKKDIISILDCSLKTNYSYILLDGNLFDDNKGLSLNIKNGSLKEISTPFLKNESGIRGQLNGKLKIKGKKENLVTKGNFTVSNVIYKKDSLGSISLNLTLKNNKVIIKKSFWKPPQGEVSISGNYDLRDKNFSFSATAQELVLDNIISRLTKKNWKGQLTGEVIAEGSNVDDRFKRKIEVKAHLKDSFLKKLTIDSLNANLSYSNKEISIKSIELYKNEDWLKAKGTLGKEKEFFVNANHFYISPLLELFGINDAKGYISLKGQYKEKARKSMVQARLECEAPGFKDIRGKFLSLNLNYNIPGKNSHLLLKDFDLLNHHLDSLSVYIISDTIGNGFSLSLSGEDILLYTIGNLVSKNSNSFLLIDTLDLKFKNAEIKNKERLEVKIAKDGITLKEGLLFLENIPISLSLGVDTRLEYSIRVSSDSLDLRTIATLLKLNKDLGGLLSFRCSGAGSLRNPRLTLNINIKNFFLEEMKANKIVGTFNYSNDEIQIVSLKILKGNEISEAEATIPLTIFRKEKDRSKRIKFIIIAKDLGGWVFYPLTRFCHYEGGKVYGTIRGEGTVGKIDMKGDLRLYSTNLYIPFLSMRMSNIEGYIQLSQEEIAIKKLKGTVNDGFLAVKGKLILRGIKPDAINLGISGEDVPIAGFKDIYLTVDPQIELKGPLSKPLLLGSIKIEKGDITIPFRRKREKGIRRGNLSYDLELSASEGNIWLKNEDADVELKGKIFAKGKGNVPQISGSFETKRGFIYYLDHTFTIEKGVFKFTNSPELNPEIDLRAETTVRYSYAPNKEQKSRDTTAVVYLNVGGTMQKPEFSLTSSNPSFTEENIILLLSLNVTSLEDLTSPVNVSALSNKAASFWIRQTLLREFQSTLGIDAIDLETNLMGPQKTAKFTVGKYISKDLYLGVTHNIFASSKDEFEIEYKVWKGSYIIGERNEDGRYNLGVRFKIKY